MPSHAEIQSVYPQALKLGRNSRSWQHNLRVLKTAVAELCAVDTRRARHIQTVAGTLQAVMRGDPHYFYERLDPAIKQRDCQGSILAHQIHESAYKEEIKKIITISEQFAPNDKITLVLAAWAHDLGIPFGIEWDHAREGQQVISHLLPRSALLGTLGQLVLFHGFHMDLTKSFLPRDIAALPEDLRRLLFIIDFCDAVSRIRGGKHSNPIGLGSIRHLLRLSDPDEITSLRRPSHLFELRFRFGFASPIHNESLSDEDRRAMLAQAQPDISAGELTNFYGSSFRCHFFNLLLSSLNTPEERGLVLVSVYRIYKYAGMNEEVTLWPDIDLGRKLKIDLPGFTSRYRGFFEKYGLIPLITADPSNKQLVFFASKLY